MKYLRRALKRRGNRKQFNKLAPILKRAILEASKETGKRMPPKRAIKKHLRKQKTKIQDRREKRRVFLDDVMAEVQNRLKINENNDKQK